MPLPHSSVRFGIHTGVFGSIDPAEAVRRAARFGLPCVELWSGQIELMDKPDIWRGVLHEARSLGLSVQSAQPVALNEDAPGARALFERARELGLRGLSLSAPHEALGWLEGLALEYDMDVGIVNQGPESAWADARAFESALRARDRHLGLCLDTGLFLRVPESPLKMIREFADRIHCVYLRDFEADEEGDEGEEYPLGQATLDLPGVLGALEDIGYGGPAIIRYEGTRHDPLEALRAGVEALSR